MFDLDDEFAGEDLDKNSGFIDSNAQSNNIENSLLNMIDDEPSETSEFVVKPNTDKVDYTEAKKVADST